MVTEVLATDTILEVVVLDHDYIGYDSDMVREVPDEYGLDTITVIASRPIPRPISQQYADDVIAAIESNPKEES